MGSKRMGVDVEGDECGLVKEELRKEKGSTVALDDHWHDALEGGTERA